jgi:hypothetical protein
VPESELVNVLLYVNDAGNASTARTVVVSAIALTLEILNAVANEIVVNILRVANFIPTPKQMFIGKYLQ